MSKIQESISVKFKSNRIIFWYDTKSELKEEFEALEESGFEKIQVQGNEFEVKYKVHRNNPNRKYLLYITGPKPAPEDNWLLDLELAHYTFHTDQEAMVLQELGLGYHLKELVAEHIEFFKSKERKTKLKELLGDGDEHEDIRGKMLAVVFNTDFVNLNTFIQSHSTNFIDGNEKFDKNLERFNLEKYYWGKIKHQFNYTSETPSIYDFLVEVFNKNFVYGSKNDLSKETRIFLLQWKDTIQFKEAFQRISSRVALDLNIESKLSNAELDIIINDNLFELCDRKIIHNLNELIVAGEISSDKVKNYIKIRENKFWFSKYKHFYDCVNIAAEFIENVNKYSATIYNSFEEGIEHYSKELYRVDLLYRKFIWNYRETSQNKIISELAQTVEKVYSNNWLLNYNNNWQKHVDATKQWSTTAHNSQRSFFKSHIQPFIEKNQRVFVIISDALRYEIGAELNNRLKTENRYESEIGSMIGSLPSYTQLGMASLLPHNKLSLKSKTDSIIVDGKSSSGIQGRTNVLQSNSGVRAIAIGADEFMNFNSSTTGREFVKQYDLIYIYHNRIDKTGDDKVSEERVFDAVEKELDYLTELLKKIANMNGNNMIITSDHGFIYQHNQLDDSDFIESGHSGTIWKENRRFIIGENLKGDNTTKAFTAKDLGIDSDADILIPKSINRLRVKGAGSRFVHGGATLQEIVIPVIKVSKKRQDTTSKVEVDIIKSTDRITTNILVVAFIQTDLATDNTLPRSLRAAIYAEDGELLSDMFKYNFNIVEGSERLREVKHRFQLMSKASGKYKNQRVKLILEEPVEGTTKWKQYKEYYYTLNISFTNDFDEF
ncbi:BREX-1 system phosphatase PglZ type A [Aequorivita flava]|uniref:BREX-1 system phosphatase PglZ type A n=1 Tax=Aequorivita flava TaxID=3114371 RepID=A0AB35YZF0_9FLAO